MKTPSYTETQVLHRFAFLNGRYWKQALRDAWMQACAHEDEEEVLGHGHQAHVGNYRSVLQGLRNDPDFGPSGLNRYKLPAGFVFRVKSR